MTRKDILIHLWKTIYDQEGWYPPLKDALKNVDAQQAEWKPKPPSNSIAELVNHLLFYKERFVYRLEGKNFPTTITSNDDTFLAAKTGYGSWNDLVKKMDDIHRLIFQKLQDLKEEDLDKPLPKEPLGAQVVSLAQHDAYHTGQIILIRKLYESWPSRRDV